AAVPANHPRLTNFVARLAQTLFSLGKFEEAIPWQNQVVDDLQARWRQETDPEPKQKLRSILHEAYKARAGLYYLLGRYAEALPHVEPAIELSEGLVRLQVRLWRAQILAHMGELARGMAALRTLEEEGALDARALSQPGSGWGPLLMDVAAVYFAAREAVLRD